MLVGMNKKIIESLNKEIKSLMNKDFDLRKSLEKLEKDLTVDDIEIEKLKKEKLKIKDKLGPKIEWYREQGISWEKIIEKAIKPGGKDIDFNRYKNK